MPERRLPYPGLRAYARNETDLFFGREGCVNEMVDRLAATRFLAVLGTSGSGKSSLVRTGLLDALELGLYSSAGSRWTIVDCHPGENPLHNLAEGLLRARFGGEPAAADVGSFTAFLARGPLAIIEWLTESRFPEDQNLLILVDQFEELFRYSDYGGREQAEAFVALLLESTRQNARVHVTLTMRSEYLGACALIPGLAEQINAGLYLARRMTRDECHEAIVGPAAVIGFDIEPALVTRLLNDLSGFAPWDADREGSQLQRLSRQADQLPLMQHVLSRLWQLAARRNTDGRLKLTLQDYVGIGELRGALEQHADEVVAGLKESSQPFVRHLFRALVTGTSLADAVRRPRPFAELVAVTGARRDQVLEIVDAFRAPDCNFLRPPLGEDITDDTLVDISHESLIRQWASLSNWFLEEAEFGAQWVRVMGAEQRHVEGREGLPSGLTLANMAAWWDTEKPNEAWANGHGGNYARVAAFLKQSREAEAAAKAKEEARIAQERKSLRRRAAFYAIAALVAAGAAFYGFYNAGVAEEQRAIAAAAAKAAEEQTHLALEAAMIAEQQRVIAADAAAAAEKQTQLALEAATEAEKQKRAAEESAKMAEEQKRAAKESESRALASLSQLELTESRPSNALKLALAAWPRKEELDGPQLRVTANSLSKSMSAFIDQVWLVGRSNGGALAVAFSPDGDRVAIPMWDDTVRVWNIAAAEEELVLVGHRGPVNDVAFSPDGTMIATSSGYHVSGIWGRMGDQTARVWDARTGAQLAVLTGHTGELSSISFSQDSARILTSGFDGTARLWDAGTGGEIARLEGHTNNVVRAVYSPNGKLIATASFDGTGRIWDAETGSLVAIAGTPLSGDSLTTIEHWLNWVTFSPDSKLIATASNGDVVVIFDALTGKQIARLRHSGDVNSVEFSPDGKELVAAGPFGMRIWETAYWQPRTNTAEETWVKNAIYSPDGKYILSRGYYSNTVGLSYSTGDPFRSIPAGRQLLFTGFSPDGKHFVATTDNGIGHLWDTETGELTRIFDPAEWLDTHDLEVGPLPRRTIATVTGRETARFQADGSNLSLFFSPDGSRIFTASNGGIVASWDGAGGRRLSTLLTLDEYAIATQTSDGRMIAAADRHDIRLVDPATGTVARELVTENTTSLAFSPDGTVLASGDEKGGVRLWRVAGDHPASALVEEGSHVRSVKFSPDGTAVASAADDGTIQLWNAATQAEQKVLHITEGASPNAIAFSNDGRSLAVATSNRGVEIWSIEHGRRLARLGTPDGYYSSVAFSPDGTRLVATGYGTAIWDTATWVEIADPAWIAYSAVGVAFSPDGNRIAVGDDNGMVQLIDISMVEMGDGFAIACQRLGDDTSLADAQERYGLGELQPICGDDPPLPADPASIR